MLNEPAALFNLFIILSFGGWLLDAAFRSWKTKSLVNHVFLRGPYLPFYGLNALLLALAVPRLHDASLPVRGAIYFAITTGSELLTRFTAELFFHLRLGDSSQKPFCVQKHICLGFSLGWVMLAFASEYLFLPSVRSFFHVFPHAVPFAAAVVGLIFIDAMVQCNREYRKRYPKKAVDKEELWADFSRIVGPLVKHPQVACLSRFTHHLTTTRLDHSLKVSWLSYQLARRCSLEGSAAARGGVLHDLFYYEWLTARPRLHGFRHPRICLKNARQVAVLSAVEEDVIIKHMWPLTILPPRYAESWIVCFVDTYCTFVDYLALFGVWASPAVSADREL